MNDILFFTFVNGVFCVQNGSVAFCSVSDVGKSNIFTQRIERKSNVLFKTFFLRGLYFFIINLIFYIKNYIFLVKIQKKEKKLIVINKMSEGLNISSKYIAYSIAGIASFLLCIVLLGILPLKISSLLVAPTHIFLKKIIVGVCKIALLYLALLSLKLINSFNQLYRFNGAVNIVAKNYVKNSMEKDYNSSTNFFVYVIFCFFTSFFVLSLLGITANNFFKPIVNFIVMLIVFGLSYEFLLFVEKISMQKLLKPIIYLVTNQPSQSEILIAQTALNEVELMNEDKNRKIIVEETNSNKLGFAYVFSEVKEKLKSAGIYDRSEADWLVAGVLQKSRGEIKLLTEINKDDYKEIKRVLERRVAGEPLTKIFGYADFYGLKFQINNFVLSPRPETEILVENAIKYCTKKSTVLDIGTGSGAIAISIAKNTTAKITAVDISEEAIKVAKQNAKNNGVKIEFIMSDLFNNLKNNKKFDIIISNPPYIKTADIVALMPEVKNFDPMIALDGGKNGLDYYKEIIKKAPQHLKKNGILMFEVGKGQATAVKKLMQKDFIEIEIVKDYNKIARIVKGKIQKYVRKNSKD